MKQLFINVIKTIAKLGAILAVLVAIYLFFLYRDIKKVDDFCSEMEAGLDVNKVHTIAEKYDIGFSYVRNQNAVENKSLGTKIEGKENTWFFVVAAPMTIGEHACSVYHDNHVVLSANSGR